MRSVVVIPARYASTRFPGKPLARLVGKPLIQHVYTRACEAKSVDRVIVATDDMRIMEAVRQFGGDCVLTGPGHRSGSDRLGEVARDLDADIIVNVQGDEPLIEPGIIDAVVEGHRGSPAPDIVTVAVPIVEDGDYGNRHVVKVVTDKNGHALYFSRAAIPHGWRKGSGGALKHVGIYGYARQSLLRFVALPAGELEQMEDLEQLRALENGMTIRVIKVDEFDGIGVDTPDDMKRAEELIKAKLAGGEDPSCRGFKGGR